MYYTGRFKLPPIIPIVFYDGGERWTATLYFNEKINHWGYFKRFTPLFMYEVIDVNSIDDRRLGELKNGVSVILKPDATKREEALKVVEELRGINKEITYTTP